MKSTGTCPKCEGKTVYAVSPVQQTYCDAQGMLRSFNITGASLPTGKRTLFGGEDTSLEIAGPFDAYVCASCGYVEWHLPKTAVRMLERMLGSGSVQLHGPTGGHGPYR